VTAGIAAPLTILAAGIAVVLLASTVAEFTRAEPSAGSFITYVETGLGPRAGVATALLVTVGYTAAMAGVFTMSGGMMAMTLAHYTSWHVPWGPLTLVLTVGAIWLTARGVRLSTTAVGMAVVAQVAIMLVVCAVVLVDERGHLSSAPFSWAHLSGGLTGLSTGFSLGALHVHRLGERPGPRRRVPRPETHRSESLYLSIAIGAALFVFFAYADRHRVPLRRLVHREVLGAVSHSGRQLPRQSGRPGLGRRDRVRPGNTGRRLQLTIAHALRRRTDRSPAGMARARPSTGRHAGERRWSP